VESLISEIFKYVPPQDVALVFVIWMQFKAASEKDKTIKEMGSTIGDNTTILTKLTTLIEMMKGPSHV